MGRHEMPASGLERLEPKKPLDHLDADEQELVLRLVLASGSLKELARSYGVSYPTIRGRLDRLIAKLRTIVAGREPDPMAELIAGMVERGEVTGSAARRILEFHGRQKTKETA